MCSRGQLCCRCGTVSVLQVVVLWVDAHADINTGSSSWSGNMHGMPVSHHLRELTSQVNRQPDSWPQPWYGNVTSGPTHDRTSYLVTYYYRMFVILGLTKHCICFLEIQFLTELNVMKCKICFMKIFEIPQKVMCS